MKYQKTPYHIIASGDPCGILTSPSVSHTIRLSWVFFFRKRNSF